MWVGAYQRQDIFCAQPATRIQKCALVASVAIGRSVTGNGVKTPHSYDVASVASVSGVMRAGRVSTKARAGHAHHTGVRILR